MSIQRLSIVFQKDWSARFTNFLPCHPRQRGSPFEIRNSKTRTVPRAALLVQQREEVAPLFSDVARLHYSLGHFLPQQLAVTLAEPVHGNSDGSRAHSQPR